MLKRIFLIVCCISLYIGANTSFTPQGTAGRYSGTAAAPLGQNGGNGGGGGPVTLQLVPIFTGLSSTLFVTHAHDGTNRLFVLEKAGRILVAQPGASSPTVFMDITGRVNSTGAEEGLLGLAFHPDYSSNGRFFVYYVHPGDGALVISEFHVSAGNPNAGDPASEIVLLTIPHPVQTNHNGGMMAFGPDGFLYLGTGDGGAGDDPPNNSQNINVLLGKMLRIDVDHPNGSVPYSSPSSNPFFGSIPGADEIYAYGLRNPWRWSFDRATGQLICGDVGQVTREEIDIITGGGNYGWRVMEGMICNPDLNGGVCTPPSGSILPIFDYTHVSGRCSITGGYIYRGFRNTLPAGAYVYADFCTGEIWQLMGANTLLMDTPLNISSFGEDEAGEIYVVGLGGTVSRLSASPAPPTCTYSFTTAGQGISVGGGSGVANFATTTKCGWIAAADVPWITLMQASGSGSGSLTFNVQGNGTGSPRSGRIHLGGATFTVMQDGSGGGPGPGPTCSPVVKPTAQGFVAVGGTGSFSLTLQAGCSWQATSSASWITFTSASSGTGSATIGFAVASNKTGSARTGTITIGSAVFTVQQQK